MAANTYPKIGNKAWTALQAKASSTPSTKFTANFVAALLGMANPDSAQANVVGTLRRFALIDDGGALTERGNKWRVSSSYAAACQEILDDIYPAELANLVDEAGSPDTAKLTTWFENEGFGESNARRMANTYALVAKKEIPQAPAPEPAKQKGSGIKPSGPKGRKQPGEVGAAEPPRMPERASSQPTLHIDIQIHIPADATVDQIDQIFSSMAKHLYAK